MLTFDSYIYIISFIFISLIHIFLWTKRGEIFINKFKKPILVLSLIIVGQIISGAMFNKEVGDVMLFSGAGHYLREKIDFYWIDSNHTQYPFFPFLIFLHAVLNWITEKYPLFTFSFYLKIVLSFALISIGLLFKKNNAKLVKTTNIVWLTRFFTCPVTYSAIYYHGQVDIILLVFLMFSIKLLQEKSWLKIIQSSFLFALSIASKTWSVLILPQMIIKIKSLPKRIVYIAIIGVFLIINIKIYTLSVFGSNFETVTRALINPGGPTGIWGISLFFSNNLHFFSQYKLIIFVVVFTVLQKIILLKNNNLFQISLLTIISFYLATPNWGVQYLFWQIPFIFFLANMNQIKISKNVLIFSSLYTFVSYLNTTLTTNSNLLNQITVLFGLILYLCYINWFVWLNKN